MIKKFHLLWKRSSILKLKSRSKLGLLYSILTHSKPERFFVSLRNGPATFFSCCDLQRICAAVVRSVGFCDCAYHVNAFICVLLFISPFFFVLCSKTKTKKSNRYKNEWPNYLQRICAAVVRLQSFAAAHMRCSGFEWVKCKVIHISIAPCVNTFPAVRHMRMRRSHFLPLTSFSLLFRVVRALVENNKTIYFIVLFSINKFYDFYKNILKW